jgi:hypothetical protein
MLNNAQKYQQKKLNKTQNTLSRVKYQNTNLL